MEYHFPDAAPADTAVVGPGWAVGITLVAVGPVLAGITILYSRKILYPAN